MQDEIAGQLRALEEELLSASTRRDGGRLHLLLHEDFREFGSSGRVFTRDQIVQELAGETAREIVLDEFRAERLEAETWLLTYRAVRREDGPEPVESLRCSLWQRAGGRWQMRFHQGTRVAAATADPSASLRNDRRVS